MKRFAFLAFVVASQAALADFNYDFEVGNGYNGSANGTTVTGQNGWYLPSVGGVDGNVMTYAGNSSGFAQDPGGGDQFLNSGYNGNNARSQHDEDFSAGGIWQLSYDFAANYTGQGGSTNNISSFSLQDSTLDKYYIALNLWDAVATPNSWDAEYEYFNAAGTLVGPVAPDANWTKLSTNHWYSESTVVDFNTNQILEVVLTDKTTNTSDVVNPQGWYMAGGANSTLPLPTAIRCFGGGQNGNQMGWDNINGQQAVPEPASFAVVGLGLSLIAARRRRKA